MLEVLEDLVQAGKIRWFGWSTDRVASFEKFAESPNCVAVQQHMNVAWDEWSNLDLLRLAERSGCASLARTPLARKSVFRSFTEWKSGRGSLSETDIRHLLDLENGPAAETIARVDAVREILQSDGRSTVQGHLPGFGR